MRKAKGSKRGKGLVKITSPIRPDVQMFVASEMADDNLIQQEIAGRASRTMIYELCAERCAEFEKEGKCKHDKQRGLSKTGVDEAVRMLNRNPASGSKIRISPTPPIINRDVVQNDQRGVEVMVYAEDLVNGNGTWASKFEAYAKIGRRGQPEANPFALETAMSKAQRNAKQALIPQDLLGMIMDELAKKPGAVAPLKTPNKVSAAVEPKATETSKMYAATMERIEQIKGDKKALKKALTKISHMAMLLPEKKEARAKIKALIAAL